jgi:hypothetical protein
MLHGAPIPTFGDPIAFIWSQKGGRHGPEEQGRNRGKVRDGFVSEETLPYDIHGLPNSRQATPESDQTVRKSCKVIKKREHAVKLRGSPTKKAGNATTLQVALLR